MVISTGRKKPHCRTCGLPMEGHKRHGRDRSPLCPSIADTNDDISRFGSEPPLAQSSPPNVKPQIQRHEPVVVLHSASTPSDVQLKQIKLQETPSPRQGLAIPESGPWHWRNPNWVDRPPPSPPRAPSPVGSLVPTVLVDSEGNTIQPEKNKSKSGLRREETSTSTMLLDRLTSLGKPAVSIYHTRLENLSLMKSAADKLGFHSGVVHKPSDKHLRDTVEKEEDENDVKVDVAYAKANNRKLRRESNYSWWLVLGQNRSAVQAVVDSQQRGMPGTIANPRELVEGPKIVTTFQLIVTGLLSGLVLLCGLSML